MKSIYIRGDVSIELDFRITLNFGEGATYQSKYNKIFIFALCFEN